MRYVILFITLFLCVIGPLQSQEPSPEKAVTLDISADPSPVVLDHQPIFYIKAGYRGYTAEKRAQDISRRIALVAKDFTIHPDTIRAEEGRLGTEVLAADQILFIMLDEDGAVERKSRQTLGKEYAESLRKAVVKFREDYSRERIALGLLYSALSTVALVLTLFIVGRLDRRLAEKMRARVLDRYAQVLEGPHGERIWESATTIRNFIRFIAYVFLLALYLQIVLGFLPWTRPFAERVLGYILGPLGVLGSGLLSKIPDLIFLFVLAAVTHFLLKAIRIFFNLIEVQRIRFEGFEPEWSRPTFNIVRIAVIAFALVIAFPYLPGSESLAFKGVSVFVGVLFSLGSSSFVANIMAGLSLVYRRAYRVGDFIQVGDVRGEVISIRLTVTQVRTVKNETVTVPNSQIINGSVINFTTLAGKSGLILHTSVTIGYDVPWRQVHALLLKAAERTAGILEQPQPFVFQTELQDFYIRYELNAYTNDSHRMAAIYSALHQNVQDMFNEYGVQIMSPNYEADPSQPKLVPREEWFKEPARPEEKET